MPMPVVPNQFEAGKNKIVHKPTKATFSFDTGIRSLRVGTGNTRTRSDIIRMSLSRISF
jgi:hypothetical protein